MDFNSKLNRLQHLHTLVENYVPHMHKSTDEGRRIHREICEVYGEVSDAFDEAVGRQSINVPLAFSQGFSTYPNFFEAGFLSGRSVHSHQGKTELLKVIGHIRQRLAVTNAPLSTSLADPWTLMHPSIVQAAKGRVDSGHFADAAEAAMKVLNVRVKQKWIASGKEEKDGKTLMCAAFSANNPTVRLADLSTESGRNIQEGYMHLFAGAMQGIRNPKAHDNLTISKERSLQFLVLASLLMSKLDEAETV